MGFFSRIKRGFSKSIGKVLEGVGNILPGRVGDAIWGKGIDLQYPTTHYDGASATADDTVDLAAECKKTCENAEQQAKSAIEDVISEAKRNLHECSRELITYIPGVSLENVGFTEARAIYRDHIAHEISLDNDQFMQILKITEKSKREAECKAFTDTVVTEAQKRTIAKINQIADSAIEGKLSELSDYINTQLALMEKTQAELRELEEKQCDNDFIGKQCTEKIVDIAYLECIRSRTYPNA